FEIIGFAERQPNAAKIFVKPGRTDGYGNGVSQERQKEIEGIGCKKCFLDVFHVNLAKYPIQGERGHRKFQEVFGEAPPPFIVPHDLHKSCQVPKVGKSRVTSLRTSERRKPDRSRHSPMKKSRKMTRSFSCFCIWFAFLILRSGQMFP